MIIYSRTALSQDDYGNLTKLTTSGPQQNEVLTKDIHSRELLERIYNQLKILNFQMATLTENPIDEIGE